MRTKKEIRKELKDLFRDNEELFNETIEELDAYNGYLGDNRYFYMEDLTDYINTSDLWSSLIYRMFYGRDDDSFYLNSSDNKVYGKFNPNRDYFYFDAYGNLISSNYKNYSYYLDSFFIDELLVNYDFLTLDADVEELLKELENANEEGED